MSIFYSIKNLFKHSAVYGIGHIVTRSLNFLLLPLYTNIFPRDNYGFVGILFTYIAILTIIYTYGLDAAFFRYYILEDDKTKRKSIFSSAFLTIFLSSVFFSTLIFMGAESISRILFSSQAQSLPINIPLTIRLASGILFFDAMTFLPFLILRAEERPVHFITFKFINVLVIVGGNILFLGFLDMGVEGVFLANLVASATTFLVIFPVTRHRLKLFISGSILKKLFAFGLYYIPSTLAVVIMDTIDRPFLERLASVEQAGLYNAGVKLGMFMALFVSAFRFAWHPFFLSTSKQENAKEIFSKVFTYVLLACLGVFLALSVLIDEIVKINIVGYSLVGKDYWSSTSVVPVVMLAYVFYAVYLNSLIGIYLKKKTKYLPPITIAGMVGNVAANYVLIPPLGIMGAAWARFIAYFIMAIALYLVGQRLYPVQYEWKRLYKLVLVVGFLFFLSRINVVSSHFGLEMGVLAAFPIILYLIGFFEKNEINKMFEICFPKRLIKR